MPEGDTIRYSAGRVGDVLTGNVPDAIETHRRFAADRWPERLAGRAVESVDAVGKYLLIRFAGGWTILAHQRLSGSWRVLPASARASGRAWLTIRRGERQAVQLGGPVVELLHDARVRSDRRLTLLGPDLVAPGEFDKDEYVRRLRAGDPDRPFGDALLDQRVLAGIGNLWKCEACFAAEISPWRPARSVSDADAVRTVELIRLPMQQSANDGNQSRHRRVCSLAAARARAAARPRGSRSAARATATGRRTGASGAALRRHAMTSCTRNG